MADVAVLRPFKGYGRSTGLSPRSPSVFEPVDEPQYWHKYS